MTAQLEHPNIVPVYAFGHDGGVPFFTMRHLKTPSFDTTLHGDPSLRTPNELHPPLEVLLKICDAIAYAHTRGIIHRDLKPQNVTVGEFGQAYLLDWGTAIRCDGGDREPDGVFYATPAYCAPEQARGENKNVDERTDVWGLGAILYQIITHRPLYRRDDFGGSMKKLLRCAAVRAVVPPDAIVDAPALPPELASICMKALQPNRDDRYQSVEELRRELQAFTRSEWTFSRCTYEAGSDIITQGELGREAFIIIEGRCDVLIDDKQVKTLGPGQVFGETGALTGLSRTATIRAIDDVNVAVIEWDALDRKLGLDSWSGRLVRTLADRFREADAQRTELRNKVAALEAELAKLRAK